MICFCSRFPQFVGFHRFLTENNENWISKDSAIVLLICAVAFQKSLAPIIFLFESPIGKSLFLRIGVIPIDPSLGSTGICSAAWCLALMGCSQRLWLSIGWLGSAAGRGGVSVLALVRGHGNSTFGALYVELSGLKDRCTSAAECKYSTRMSNFTRRFESMHCVWSFVHDPTTLRDVCVLPRIMYVTLPGVFKVFIVFDRQPQYALYWSVCDRLGSKSWYTSQLICKFWVKTIRLTRRFEGTCHQIAFFTRSGNGAATR